MEVSMETLMIISYAIILGGLGLLVWMFRKIYVRGRARAYERWKHQTIEDFEVHMTGYPLYVYSHTHQVYGAIRMQVQPYEDSKGTGTLIGFCAGDFLFAKHRTTVTLRSGRVISDLPFNGRFVKIPHLEVSEISTIQFDARKGSEPT